MLVFNIKSIRIERNMTLMDLHRKTKLSYSYLWKLENNKNKNPRILDLEKIAAVFNVNIKKLLYSCEDIEEIRNEMHTCIDKYGLKHPKTLNYSQLMDLLIILETDKKRYSTNFGKVEFGLILSNDFFEKVLNIA